MAPTKKYDTKAYEEKLGRVMDRFGIEKYNWDYTRHEAWVEFFYKGQLYRFEHSVANAAAHGQPLTYGSDAFAQIVLALEDLARISGRGIYDLQAWVSGFRALPKPETIPEPLQILGFTHMPTSREEVRARYLALVKTAHSDVGGSDDLCAKYNEAYEQAIKLF